jgi:hypothetical protein
VTPAVQLPTEGAGGRFGLRTRVLRYANRTQYETHTREEPALAARAWGARAQGCRWNSALRTKLRWSIASSVDNPATYFTHIRYFAPLAYRERSRWEYRRSRRPEQRQGLASFASSSATRPFAAQSTSYTAVLSATAPSRRSKNSSSTTERACPSRHATRETHRVARGSARS